MALTDLPEKDLAYLAGIFDGEGCVGYYKRPQRNRSRYSYIATILIAQSDPRLMTWIEERVGFGTVYSKLAPKARKIGYAWETNKRGDVIEFLGAMLPYLVLKKEQAELLLNHLRWEGAAPLPYGGVTSEILARREATSLKMKALKKTYNVPELALPTPPSGVH